MYKNLNNFIWLPLYTYISFPSTEDTYIVTPSFPYLSYASRFSGSLST